MIIEDWQNRGEDYKKNIIMLVGKIKIKKR
jgi:hypothetical protein